MRQPDEPEDLGGEYDYWRCPPPAPLWILALGIAAGAVLVVATLFFIYGTASCIAVLKGILP